MKAGLLSPSQQICLDAITEAAAKGARCPTNRALQDLLGCMSVATPAQVLNALEARGLVKVKRFQRGREVLVTSTGRSTGRFTGARRQHWRCGPGYDRIEGDRLRLERDAEIVSRRTERMAALALPIDRSPCPRCGTRGDIGCAHNPRPSGAAA